MRKLIETARGERVEIEEAYRAHVAACATYKRRPAPFSSFAESLTSFCQANRIRMRATNETVYLLNRRILSSQRDGVLIGTPQRRYATTRSDLGRHSQQVVMAFSLTISCHFGPSCWRAEMAFAPAGSSSRNIFTRSP